VIKHNKIARKYTTLMTRLGVDISESKTHVSVDTYEFAKRWIRNGKELSGLSLKGILNNIKNTHLVYMNIFNYILRNPHLSVDLLGLMGTIYGGLKVGSRCKSRKTIIKSLYDFHHSIRHSFGLLTYDELRSYMCRKFNFDVFNI